MPAPSLVPWGHGIRPFARKKEPAAAGEMQGRVQARREEQGEIVPRCIFNDSKRVEVARPVPISGERSVHVGENTGKSVDQAAFSTTPM
jgi:hypothetical protein